MHEILALGSVLERTVEDNPVATTESRALGFEPMFLNEDPLISGKKSMRIFRIRNLASFSIEIGEIWAVAVADIHIGHRTPLTRDQRMKIFIYVDLLHKVEVRSSCFFDSMTSMLRITYACGSHFRTEAVPATTQRRCYRFDKGVIDVEEVLVKGEVLHWHRGVRLDPNEWLTREMRALGGKGDPKALRRRLAQLPPMPQFLHKAMEEGRI